MAVEAREVHDGPVVVPCGEAYHSLAVAYRVSFHQVSWLRAVACLWDRIACRDACLGACLDAFGVRKVHAWAALDNWAAYQDLQEVRLDHAEALVVLVVVDLVDREVAFVAAAEAVQPLK